MSGESGKQQPKPLSRAERIQLTWALVWPGALLNLAYVLLRSQLRGSETSLQIARINAVLESIDGTVGALGFFLFSTWVVRRTVRLDFPEFHLLAIRAGAEGGNRTMMYRESLSVAWLLKWRTVMYSLPLGVAVFVLRHGPPPQEWYSPLNWLWISAAEILIFYLWIVNAALGKRYSDFSLGVRQIRSDEYWMM
jgi:hypothetical protein